MTEVKSASAVAPASVVAEPAAPIKPRRRWFSRLLMLLGCSLVVAGWFAPMIVAQTELKQQVPKLLFPLYPGKVEIGSASLGWLQSVVVRDLHATDAEGNPFLDVKEFSTSLPLWKLAVSQANLGRLILLEPKVNLQFRADGSNAEDVLAKMMSGPPSKAPIPDFDLEVHGATVVMEHKETARSSTIQPLSLVVQSQKGAIEEFEVTIGDIPDKDAASLQPATDWIAFRFGNEPTQDGVAMTPGSKHIRLKAVGWNLDKLLPAVARIEPTAELAGTIDADARSQVNLADAPSDWTKYDWSWDGRITISKFVLAGLSALKQDRVTLESTSLAGRVAAQQQRLSMQGLQLQTEVGELTATGDIPLAGIEASPLNAFSSILADQDYTIHGHLDLQRLAALLPNTLRVREGTQVTSGSVDVNLKSELQNSARTWTADATVDKLAATNQGKPVSWNEPIKLNLLAHRAQDLVTIDQMTCQSDFFKLTGKGSLTDATFTANGDLNRLEENLQQFIDLGIDKIAGKLKIEGEIRRADADQVTLTAVVQMDNFQWNLSKDTVWQEAQLVLGMHAAAKTTGDSTLTQIQSGDMKLTSGPDTLVAALQQPVDLTSKAPAYAVKASLGGNLQTWQNRLRPFVSFAGWQLGGTTKIDTTITANPDQIELVSLTGDVTNLDARGPQWWIKEPQVKLESAGIWSVAQSQWTSPQTTVTATALAVRVHELLVDLKPNGQLERITGDAAFRGDLDKLSRWKNQALPIPSYTLMGTLEGRANLVEEGTVITADLDATVTKLVVADLETLANRELHWVALWREPELHLLGKGTYDLTADNLQLETASVQGDGLSVNAHGTLAQLSTTQQVDLQGELGYDWAIVSQRMGDSLKKSVQLTGKQTRPITLNGSLASLGSPNGLTDLAGTAGIGWDSAAIEGLPVGPTDISAKLEKGIAQFAPIETTVAQGKLHLTPQIRLDRNPSILVLPTEKVIQGVQITPELCNQWLKYVAPMLADATQIDGQFSLDVTNGALPLSAPMKGDMAGTLSVHQVRVRPGPGGLQITSFVDQIRSIITRKAPAGAPQDRVWMQMPEQAIPIKLVGGRAYHQNVTVQIGEGTVVSSGSVGLLDESVDLVLQIAILEDWIKDQKLLAGFKGKSLKVPVRGSLSQFQLDPRVLTDLATQIGGSAIEGALGGALEDKVDDLFKGKLKKFLPGQQ
jgi:translocation and assembly module TamB